MQTAQIALQNFLRAFSQLQLDELMACFADDATAFFPIEHHCEQLAGKAAIREAFAQVIARVRTTGATRMNLEAEGMQTQAYDDIAIITFHIRGEHLSRRTFVLRRADNEWRIAHFHGSNAPIKM
jgi:ketosteroid isomerase-like protein